MNESNITARVRQAAKKLALAGNCADDIAARLRIPLVDAEAIISHTNQARQVDPELIWAQDRQRMELSPPTKQLFVRLFAEHNRKRIILESVNLIRKYVAAHAAKDRKWEFDDLEQTCIVAVIEETDRLLAKNIEHDNPGSMLIEVIRGTIYAPNPEHHSRKYHVYKPRERDTDEARDKLIRELTVAGHTKNYIQSELDLRGYDRSKIVTDESPWPSSVKTRDSMGGYDGGEVDFDFGELQPAVDERWELLSEVCTDEELLILNLLSQGHTRPYVAKAIGCHVSTITKRIAGIREKVQAHVRECDGDV